MTDRHEIQTPPPEGMKAKYHTLNMIHFLKDAGNKDVQLYLINMNPNSEHYGEQYTVYLHASGGWAECKSSGKPYESLQLTPQIKKTDFLYITEETAKTLKDYFDAKEQAQKKIAKRRIPLGPYEPLPTPPAKPSENQAEATEPLTKDLIKTLRHDFNKPIYDILNGKLPYHLNKLYEKLKKKPDSTP